MDHTTPTLPEPDLFERLVTIVDSAVSARGWYSPHVLIKVVASDDPEAFDLGLKELPEGSHPADELWGFEAPPSWLAIGVVTFGWASPMGEGRPSLHPDRVRVRATILVTRDGRLITTASFEDGTAIDQEGDGLVADVLRRCLGVPTTPPPPIEHLAEILWLQALAADARDAADAITPAVAIARYIPPEGRVATWEGARLLAHASGRWPFADTWMDDGFFARQLLASLPTVDDLLDELSRFVARETLDAVLELLAGNVIE